LQLKIKNIKYELRYKIKKQNTKLLKRKIISIIIMNLKTKSTFEINHIENIKELDKYILNKVNILNS